MSETANLKLFKHDEVIEESEIRFNIRKSLNENWDKIDNKYTEQDNKLSTLQTENIKLKEENERLKEDLKGLPSGIVSGESIDLKDSSEMRVLNFEIGGNSRQEKREGYNLIDLNNSNNRYLNKVNNGFKLSKANNRVSTISFNKPLSVGTYTLTLKKVNTTLTMEENAVRFSFKNALSEDISIYDLTNKNKITATINQECSSLYFYISANEVDTAEITFDDVQLVQGTEEKTFEPYGVSPSPDYPSEVQCCGDNVNMIEETFKGYNINGNGAFEVLNSFDIQIANVKANVKYVLNTTTNLLAYYNEKPTISSITYDNSRVVLSSSTNIITPTKSGYIAIRTNSLKGVKLEEGIIQTPYSTYGQGNINVDICNKNLFDISDKVAYHSGNTSIEEINDGIRIYYIGSNTSTNTVFRTYKIKKILKSDIGKTIKLKAEISTSNLNTGQYNIGYCDENVSLRTSVEASKNSGHIISMNINQEMVGKYIAIWFYANSGGGTIVQNDYVDFTKIQLEYDNISDYMLNKAQMYTIPTQQPMRAIGEYKDTFIKKDGKWYERHFVKRLILEGTEAKWALYTTGTRRYGLDLSTDLPLKIINKYGIGYSSHFEIKNIISSDLIMFLQVELNHFYVGITDINTKWNSTNDLKGWLSEQNNAGAPVYVDYVLETPIDIKCTAEQTEILEKIENEAKTYKNVTHIYSTDEINPNMKVTYFKDIETIIGG